MTTPILPPAAPPPRPTSRQRRPSSAPQFEPPNPLWINRNQVLAQFPLHTVGAHGGQGAARTMHGYIYPGNTCSCRLFKVHATCPHVIAWQEMTDDHEEPNTWESYFAEPRGGGG